MAAEIEYLSPLLVREMCHELAVTFFNRIGEPIPPFETANVNLLESSLALPRATFSGAELYPTITDKGAMLFYAIIKDHPFDNGNKRIAVTALLVFLYMNDWWLRAGQREMYNWAIYAAASPADQKDRIVVEINQWLVRKLISRTEAFRVRRRTIIFRILWQLPGMVARLVPTRIFRR